MIAPFLRPVPTTVSACVVGALCVLLASSASPARGQGYDSWSKVEQAEETRTYGQQLAEGTFEAAQKSVLENVMLKQLALPSNRSTIAQVRQRMREIITRGTTNPKMFDAVNAATATFMSRLAADESQDIVVRVNAMALIGELVAGDRKAWTGSIEPLAQAASNEKLPLAVRIAAMAGLVRQVQDGRGGDPAFAKAVGPVISSIVTKPPEGDPRAVAWLVSRCFELAPVVGSSPAVLTAAAGMLADEAADIDVRIRAALSLGRLMKAGAAPATAVSQIQTLATTALARDLADAESRRFAKQLSGGVDQGAMGGMPGAMTPSPPPPPPAAGGGLFGGGIFGGEPVAGGTEGDFGMPTVVDLDAIPSLACRRNAWRLVALADALQPEGSNGAGIASALKGDAAAEAIELATVLREQGRAIESTPDEQSVKVALAAIEALAKPARPEEPAPGPAPATDPAAPATPPADTPFGAPGEPSPF